MKPADECLRREDKVRDPQRVSERYDLISFIYTIIFFVRMRRNGHNAKSSSRNTNLTTRLICEIKQNRHLQHRVI